ncbi:ketopantoate hydroxymethyltransferase [Paenibacillus sp. PR3]|uniref:Ketopantoate hydroxymethyltransferase n=1 Tax=Paenibacillus terricola TaxID=2763503 RepID=A0ABR8MS17_9BACL|nr:ketopantoate hydroxymethyltransferase [Paenibacillus terricola]MBD3917640.1 ketopantoate hydroxymethyltransferase [Paenibacillus terricola]
MITSAFKNELAEYTAGRITKVSLNSGAYVITAFTVKQVDNGTVTLNYLIPLGAVATVNRVEVKSSTVTISDHPVSIPIATDTLIVQVISVEE